MFRAVCHPRPSRRVQVFIFLSLPAPERRGTQPFWWPLDLTRNGRGILSHVWALALPAGAQHVIQNFRLAGHVKVPIDPRPVTTIGNKDFFSLAREAYRLRPWLRLCVSCIIIKTCTNVWIPITSLVPLGATSIHTNTDHGRGIQYPNMSSAEEDYNDIEIQNSSSALPDNKKRRVQRACDTCRRKKSQY